MDLEQLIEEIIQGVLFGLFGELTAVLSAVLLPTYNNLLVPELNGSALFPVLSLDGSGGAGFLTVAAEFSEYLLVTVVDPAIVIVVLAVGVVFLARSSLGRWGPPTEGLFPRVLVAIVVANFTVPIANVLLGFGGTIFPIVAAFDGGAWRDWENLAGPGEIGFSWQNGAIAFVLSFALFFEIVLLAVAVAFRDAALAVLLVLLPAFTLVWPIPTLAPLARRAWRLFGELVVWPCVVLIPLELAVASPNVLILVAYLALALASPALLSTAGTHLGHLGLPGSAGVVSGGIQRGFNSVSPAATGLARPWSSAGETGGAAGSLLSSVSRAAGASSFPATVPLVGAELLGRGAHHLVSHLSKHGPNRAGPGSPPKTVGFPPSRPGSGR
ncbi:MAG: hypothetical protein WCA77_08890 [Thermoplasmata archaeon]